MDPISLIYYALICAALSFLAPSMRTSTVRLAVGALVGMAAAGVLPVLQQAVSSGY
ncbi:hypothetical protein [Actibacterium mucosum]|uniref:hypothetical protein n=1 Tax=Actibacterium mucosum TaxID=1087332 RepID=UPI00137656A0|nr:hypothetical protein [Actibacterium mucosum]